MIRIRLKRIGKKRHPHYRMVVADKPDKRDGRFIENLGSYDPHADPPLILIDGEKVKSWIAKGAQPSESAEKILIRAGVIEKKAPFPKVKLEAKRAEQAKAAEGRAKTRAAAEEKAEKEAAKAAAAEAKVDAPAAAAELEATPNVDATPDTGAAAEAKVDAPAAAAELEATPNVDATPDSSAAAEPQVAAPAAADDTEATPSEE
jgi:small subunit ribosomal protein S16